MPKAYGSTERFNLVSLKDRFGSIQNKDRVGQKAPPHLPSGNGLLTITLDDGYMNQFEKAFPVMEKLGLRGVSFITTGFMGRRFMGDRMMGVEELKALSSAGWEVGSHSVSHAPLVALSDKDLKIELGESCASLQSKGFPVISFAYPFGMYDERVEREAGEYYKYRRSTEEGLNDFSSPVTRLKALTLREGLLKKAKKAVDKARAKNKWLIVLVHAVVDSKDHIPPFNEVFGWVTRKEFSDFVEYASSRIPVVTFSDM